MIIVGDILIRDDVQTMILQLLRHVGSPTSLTHCSHQSRSHQTKHSCESVGSPLIGDHRHSSRSRRLRSHQAKLSHKSPILDPTLLLDSPAAMVPSSDLGSSSNQHLSLPPVPSPSLVPSPSSAFLPTVYPSGSDDSATLSHLHSHDLQLVAREGVPCNITDASFETSFCNADMARVVYRLQDNNAPSSIDNERKIDNGFSNIVSKKDDNDFNDVVSIVLMIDSTIDNMEKYDNNHDNIVLMMVSALEDMVKSDDDLGDIMSTICSTASIMKKNKDDPSIVVSMIDSTLDNTRNNDDDLNDVVLMINSTIDDTKKYDDDSGIV